MQNSVVRTVVWISRLLPLSVPRWQFPCQLLRNVQSYVSRSSAGSNLAVELLLIVFRALSFWTRRLGFEVASAKTHISHERHACKTFPFPMNTFHFVNCLMFRIKRLSRSLEGCWLACRILLWGPWCGFLDCCLFLCPGGSSLANFSETSNPMGAEVVQAPTWTWR